MSEFMVSEEGRKKLAIFLKKIREEKDFGLNQLALKAKIQKTILSRIEAEKVLKINPFILKNLAEALGIDYKVLYQIVGYLEEEKKTEIESNLDLTTGFKEIPIYPSISAGFGLEEAQQNEIEFVTVPKTRLFKGDVIGVRVNGDSMEYTIENGVVAFIKRGVEVPNKKVGAFILDNRPLLKRFICVEKECFLRSDNRDYPDIHIGKESHLEVVGRYIGSIDLNGEIE